MGSSPSQQVSVIAEGETESPFSVRRHPDSKKSLMITPTKFKNMQDLTLDNFEKYGKRPYLGERKQKNGKFEPELSIISYDEGFQIAKNFGSGLKMLSITLGSVIGIYSENCPAWLNTIDASSLYGFIIVSLYDSLGVDAISYLVDHSKMEAIIVSQKNYPKIIEVLKSNPFNVKFIIVIGEKIQQNEINIKTYSFKEIIEIGSKNISKYPKIDPESPHIICYSSGTTGNPKGVVISHRAFVSNTLSAAKMIDMGKEPRHISYLPLAHVFERNASIVVQRHGGLIAFNSNGILSLKEDLSIIRPTFLPAVPRVINRFYDGIHEQINSSFIKKGIFWGCWYGKKLCLDYSIPTFLFDILAFNKIKKAFGGELSQIIVGGAALDANIQEFMMIALGTPVRTGYGLTEAGSGNTINPIDFKKIKCGTVGGPMVNAEVKIEPIDGYDDPNCGEILIGGPCLSSGYLYDEEATKNLFVDDDHKWIHTGDVGKWDKDGYLIIVDRMRSIFKLSQGEYVAAEMLTQIYDSCELVAQSFIYGDSSRVCLVAIIIPDQLYVAKFYGKSSLTNGEFKSACKSEKLKKAIMEQLTNIAKEKKLFGYMYIKSIELDHEPWTIENDMLTPTFKLKRKKLENKYKNKIESLYKTNNPK